MEGDKLKYADGTHTAVHAAVKDDSYECCTCCHQTPMNWIFLRSSCTVPDIVGSVHFAQGISGVDAKFKASLVSLRFDPSCGFCLTEILSSQIHHGNAFYKSTTSLLTRAIEGPRERQLWVISGFDQCIFCKGAN